MNTKYRELFFNNLKTVTGIGNSYNQLSYNNTPIMLCRAIIKKTEINKCS